MKTISDLARFDPTILAEKFGAMGTQLYSMAHGIDRSEVEERTEVKSIRRETTFEEDTSDFDLVLSTLDKISESVHRMLSNRTYTSRR